MPLKRLGRKQPERAPARSRRQRRRPSLAAGAGADTGGHSGLVPPVWLPHALPVPLHTSRQFNPADADAGSNRQLGPSLFEVSVNSDAVSVANRLKEFDEPQFGSIVSGKFGSGNFHAAPDRFVDADDPGWAAPQNFTLPPTAAPIAGNVSITVAPTTPKPNLVTEMLVACPWLGGRNTGTQLMECKDLSQCDPAIAGSGCCNRSGGDVRAGPGGPPRPPWETRASRFAWQRRAAGTTWTKRLVQCTLSSSSRSKSKRRGRA